MMIDRYIEQHPLSDTTRLRESVCFLVDNVASFLEESKDKLIDKDIPNAAPPYDNMWFEHKPVRRLHGGIGGLRRIGMHIVVNDKTAELLQDPGIQERYSELLKRPDIKWVLMATLFFEAVDGCIKHFDAFSVLLITTDGKVELGDRNKVIGFTLEGKPESVEYLLAQGFAAFWLVPLMSIAFLHCKNVEIFQEIPSERLQKARNKRGKAPLVYYHILNIKPMRQVLHTEGQQASGGLSRALHICRGHFKDYTDKGLFGRNRGLYWWDSQVRGNAKQGVALKDYKVSPPESVEAQVE